MRKDFHLPVWVHLIDYLSIPDNANINLNKIARKYYTASYSHLLGIIKDLERNKILKVEKLNGRSNRYEFTKKGQELAKTINLLKAQLNEG
jgi:predicted transcriptional regulator